MVRIAKLILFSFLFISQNLYSNSLNKDEEMYFNFVDLNNDELISLLEMNQSISIIFQLIDFNQDGFISRSEITEPKKIVESLR